MATYYNHGSSEVQASDGGIHTLYLMNPNYVTPFSDETLHHHHHQSHQLVGIPLSANNAAATGSNNSDDDDPAASSTIRPSAHQFPTAFHGTAAASRVPYSLCGGPMVGDSSGVTAIDVAAASQMAFRRPPEVPVVTGPTLQGLSLSLSSQQTVYPSEHEVPVAAISRATGLLTVGNSQSSSSGGFGGGVQSVLLGSKYLKAVQEILDEVINVGKEITKPTNSSEIGTKQKMKMNRESTPTNGGSSSGGGSGSGAGSKQPAELTTAQRQELQMKKAKLASMLDEVEHRYRQYHHQMQIITSSFEQAAGFGSSKSYTALALQTISKQFRCLKDAISSQIKATGKSLGEDDEECLGAKIEGSRLRYVDHQLRQQRALQQLGMGMIQHNNNNAWRPQRGLPERAVSVLRAWLFEHFLHPYPKDSDKVLLAKQTGLTRSQVSNWFINARVRLWKPMVEEMYLEETKEQEQKDDTNPQQDNNKNKGLLAVNKKTSSTSSNLQDHSTAGAAADQISIAGSLSTSPMGVSNSSQLLQSPSGLNVVGSKKRRSTSEILHSNISPTPTNSSILSMDMEYRKVMSETSERQRQTNKDNTYNSFITVATSEAITTGFGAYPNNIGHDLGRFQASVDQFTPRFHGNNSGISLTLGLPHIDNNLSLSGTQKSYLSNSNQNIPLGIRRMEEIGTRSEADQFFAVNQQPQSSQYSTAGFENMDMQNRKRFAAQLLPDFVT
ncbi:hypothetical protein FEM48_Zijuj02G0007800 [Ziziphus jujuba var. spinosa]|uniref:Homeobox domain-containing protein n=1 Tax=Ziziphus jujuba var. spinosa TaxID=714518 RepID=A0A978VSM2_ZIZJJ|nr:hypothetical protein FEM48_Zijuj02G0007800 [Ziziphus jujuba var. spinosa]